MPDQHRLKTIRHYLPHILSGITFILSLLVGKAWGFQSLRIPWNYWQLLDQQALTQQPWHSLLLLHAQPPLLNALLAGILKWADLVGLTLEFWAHALFTILGLLSVVLLYQTAFSLAKSKLLSMLAIFLFLFNPASYVFSHIFFYPYLLAFLLITLQFLLIRTFQTGAKVADTNLWTIAGIIVIIVNLRSLYHPLWGLSLFGVILLLKFARGEQNSRFSSPGHPPS